SITRAEAAFAVSHVALMYGVRRVSNSYNTTAPSASVIYPRPHISRTSKYPKLRAFSTTGWLELPIPNHPIVALVSRSTIAQVYTSGVGIWLLARHHRNHSRRCSCDQLEKCM